MKSFKPHFGYNKRQRNGVFYLLVIIVLIQLFSFSLDKMFTRKSDYNPIALDSLQTKLDSLNGLKFGDLSQFKINPNFMTDEIGYQIGMTVKEIDRLLLFRKNKNWINNLQDFKKVTLVSDSLLISLKEVLEFPKLKKTKKKKYIPATSIKKDLNLVSAKELIRVKGVGEVLSKRIVKYRKSLQGFCLNGQLFEVYGLKKEVANNILEIYTVQTIPNIDKLNVNKVSFKRLLSLIYLDYETTKKIFQYKKEVGKIKNITELKKIAGFPIDKFDRIALYLHAE